MGKFDKKLATAGSALGTSPIATVGTKVNHEGASAFARDEKSDLFLLAVSNFVGEKTFYESAQTRDDRFVTLVHAVTKADPAWMQRFIPWLRTEGLMRSASVVAAVEYVRAGGPNGRSVIASAIARADEPGEVLSYYIATYGRAIPAAIKRGVADAAGKFYSQRNVLKYDTGSTSMRFGDVVQLVHPRAKTPVQNSIFKTVLDRRYGTVSPSDKLLAEGLDLLAENARVRAMDPAEAREYLLSNPFALGEAGMTWEALSGFGPMDAAAWEAMIPNMGYMALLRNLRNFDQAGVSDTVADLVVAKLTDPDEVARSRQLPFRFWSAYNASQGSLRWARALERALDMSTSNVPELPGKTLVLVDTSASMTSFGYSERSKVTPFDAGSLFGAVLARKNAADVTLVTFATSAKELTVKKGDSALKIKERFSPGQVGHGTEIGRALQTWSGQDRVVLITDMQTQHYVANRGGIPAKVPVYGFNLGGYSSTALDLSSGSRNYEFGGLTDRTFTMIKLIEAGRAGSFPF